MSKDDRISEKSKSGANRNGRDLHNEPCMPCIVVLGTCDTKLEELLYVRKHLLDTHNVCIKLVDVGRTPSTHPAVDISQPAILAWSSHPPPSKAEQAPHSVPDVSTLPRNELIRTLAAHAGPMLASLLPTRSIHGIIALGGSGGSALAAGVFRALPLGFPKLLVSTMAAGDVGPFVQDADVAIMYSVVDIAGLNDILCPILENAAGAIAGMARAYQVRLTQTRCDSQEQAFIEGAETKAGAKKVKRVAITMFGVTTPAVTHARALLSHYACTCYVFHATGAGGRALERLISDGFFDGVLDLTTTELADELVGGVLSAGPHRLEAAARKGVPQVVSLGALDMVNFGPRDSVPERWVNAGRRLYEHNPSVTLMRTTADEGRRLGQIIVEKLAGEDVRENMTEVWIPTGGVSALSVRGATFEDRKADEALFGAVKEGSEKVKKEVGRKKVVAVERKEDINDPRFVEGMVGSLVQMMCLERVNDT